jgi:hypothetical protein
MTRFTPEEKNVSVFRHSRHNVLDRQERKNRAYHVCVIAELLNT